VGVSDKIAGFPPNHPLKNSVFQYVHHPFWWKTLFLETPYMGITLPETNVAPENQWLEDEFPFGKDYFQGRTVGFKEGILSSYMGIITHHYKDLY